MSKQKFKMNTGAVLLSLIAAAYPVVGYTAPAARVDFVTGDVRALGANGQSRPLARGAQIEQGETIATNRGRAQLRFTDGAYVSLQPESEFRIDQYRFDGKQDGNEKGFFSLVKGGLRTITGLVGRNNKNNYQITTSVATIGIRGTEYTIQYGQSVTGTVGEGEINVCNGAGCLSVMNGESYYVQNQEIKPVLTNKRTDLPPPPPQSPPPEFKESENVTENGDSCVLFPSQCGPTPLLTGTANFHVGYMMESGSHDIVLNQPAVLQNGNLISFTRGSQTDVSGPYSEVGGDSIIAWGSAANSSGGEALRYVAGIPAPNSGLAALGGMVATYSLMAPTSITSGTTPIGTLTNMTMTADFFSAGSASLDISMTMTIGGNQRTPTGSASYFFGSGASFFSFCASQQVGCSTITSVGGKGFFAGTNAERVGFIYNVSDNPTSVSGVGVGGLTQTSKVPSGGQ